MESKVCTYTEKDHRLQLVLVTNDIGVRYFEIRYNRKVIYTTGQSYALHARFFFLHAVHEICVNRSTTMLNLTTQNT